MNILTTAKLIYVGLGKASNGSPINLTIEKEVKVTIEEQFSQYYYRNEQRIMRKSKNISLPIILVNDIQQDGVNYELQYVLLSNKKYQVKEVLKHKSTMLTLLDVQEVAQ